MNRLQKRDSGPDFANFSLNSYGYSPRSWQNLASLSHFFATIPLSPTDS